MKWYDPEKKIQQAVKAGLTACGVETTYWAKVYVPKDTNNLYRSINWKLRGNSVLIGTSVEYAVYQEFGTGKHAEGGKGRKGGWSYIDKKTGKKIWTFGNRKHPFLRPALDKVKTYVDDLFTKEFKRVIG